MRARGIKGLVVISAGFMKLAAKAASFHKRLRPGVRANAGMRMVGPNRVFGVVNTNPNVRLDACFC